MPKSTKIREKSKARDIGVDVPPPKGECSDSHCPFHGVLPVRGQSLEGTVVSTKMSKTVVVEREYLHFMKKYERYEKRTRRILAHAPPCLELSVGSHVTLMECRPLSKVVSHVVVENKGVAV